MAKYQRRDFQCGEYWLSQRDGSAAFCRTWFDTKTRQTKRVSLGTATLEEAKQRLAEWYAGQFQAPSDDLPPSAVKLAEVLLDYWNGQGKGLRSEATVKFMLRYWTEFWGDVSVATVREPRKQEEFRLWLASEKRLGHNSVNRCLEIGRSAIRRAWKRGVISSAPFIQMLPSIETDPMGRPLTREEARRLYQAATQDHLRLYLIIGLATGARPEAITDLTWDRVDFANGLIHLNPPGRVQNKKHRPTVKVGPVTLGLLQAAMEERQGEHVIMFRRKHVHRLDTAWEKAVVGAGLDKRVTLYSLRHTVARDLRAKGVDTMEIANMLGHKKLGFDMTMRYAPHDPAYLRKSVEVLDGLVLFCVRACEERVVDASGEPAPFVGALEINQV